VLELVLELVLGHLWSKAKEMPKGIGWDT